MKADQFKFIGSVPYVSYHICDGSDKNRQHFHDILKVSLIKKLKEELSEPFECCCFRKKTNKNSKNWYELWHE